MVKCPGCGKPLVKRSRKGRYYCENDGCPVLFVRWPHNLAIRSIVYEPSASEDAIRKIEKTRVGVSKALHRGRAEEVEANLRQSKHKSIS